jgi:hypothetical protein
MDVYSGGTRFESQADYVTKNFVVLFDLSKQMQG